jgi:hypothetical protein
MYEIHFTTETGTELAIDETFDTMQAAYESWSDMVGDETDLLDCFVIVEVK